MYTIIIAMLNGLTGFFMRIVSIPEYISSCHYLTTPLSLFSPPACIILCVFLAKSPLFAHLLLPMPRMLTFNTVISCLIFSSWSHFFFFFANSHWTNGLVAPVAHVSPYQVRIYIQVYFNFITNLKFTQNI